MAKTDFRKPIFKVLKEINGDRPQIQITYQDQIKYNYSLDFYKYDYHGKIFPENFCYGLLTYNISRNDFNDIIRKNMSNYLFLISYLKFILYLFYII